MTSIMTLVSSKTKRIIYVGLFILICSILDALTTFIALRIGFIEGNHYGVAILETSPFIFYTQGTLMYIALGIIVATVVEFHQDLFKIMMVFMVVVAIIKLAPVIWNIANIILY